MKKYLSILCATALMSGLCACGEEVSSSVPSSSSSSESETSAEKSTEEEKTESKNDGLETEQSTESTTEHTEEQEAKVATASDIMAQFTEKAPDVGNYVEYTEETDVNNLLGRPNQYTSKINFAVTTIEQKDETDPAGGSIEVFENNEDATARYEYIQQLVEEMPYLAEYGYVNDYVLLRMNFAVTPSVEKEYEKILDEYMDSIK